MVQSFIIIIITIVHVELLGTSIHAMLVCMCWSVYIFEWRIPHSWHKRELSDKFLY